MNMMKTYCLFVLIVILSFCSFAQDRSVLFANRNELNLAVNLSKIATKYTPCLQIELNHIYKDRYFIGVYLNGGSTATNDSFGYAVKSPVVSYVSFGVQNGIKLIKRKKLTVSSSISNNLGIISLVDNAEQHSSFNGIVFFTTSKEVKTTYCYSVLPKLEIAYRIWNTLYFYSGVGYQLNIGTTFTDMQSFNGPNVNIGLQLQFD